MALHRLYALIGLCVFASPAVAEEYATEVNSQVYQTPGTPREIATRGGTCIAQNLRPGTTEAPLIMNSDLDNGVIVAQSALEFYAKANVWRIRSTFTFEAREGRFRINQTNLELFSPTMNKWSRFLKGGVGTKAQETFAASAVGVAQCVIAGSKQEDW